MILKSHTGLHLGATTVRRMLHATPKPTPQPLDRPSLRVVTGKRPDHVWHLDILAGGLPSYHMIKDKVQVSDPQLLLRQIEEHFRDEQLDLTDGVRINRPGAWALVRASGTEPLVRILAESDDEGTAKDLYYEIRQVLNQR